MLRTVQSLPLERAFDTGLRPDPFPDRAASLLPGLLAATRTGLPPASDDELTTTDQPPTRSTSCLLGARENLIVVRLRRSQSGAGNNARRETAVNTVAWPPSWRSRGGRLIGIGHQMLRPWAQGALFEIHSESLGQFEQARPVPAVARPSSDVILGGFTRKARAVAPR